MDDEAVAASRLINGCFVDSSLTAQLMTRPSSAPRGGVVVTWSASLRSAISDQPVSLLASTGLHPPPKSRGCSATYYYYYYYYYYHYY